MACENEDFVDTHNLQLMCDSPVARVVFMSSRSIGMCDFPFCARKLYNLGLHICTDMFRYIGRLYREVKSIFCRCFKVWALQSRKGIHSREIGDLHLASTSYIIHNVVQQQ